MTTSEYPRNLLHLAEWTARQVNPPHRPVTQAISPVMLGLSESQLTVAGSANHYLRGLVDTAAIPAPGRDDRTLLLPPTSESHSAVTWLNASTFISGGGQGTVTIWRHDPASGTWRAEVCGSHDAAVIRIALTADGARAVSASLDNTLRVWDLASALEHAVLRGHENPVGHVALSADGARAVSASDDKTLRVWDLASAREIAVLRGHENSVLHVALTADGARAVSASDDNTLRVWDLASAREIAVLHCGSPLTHVSWQGDDHIIASGHSGIWRWAAQDSERWQLAWHARLIPQGSLCFGRKGVTVRIHEPIYTERVNGKLVPADPRIDGHLLLWDGVRVRRPYDYPALIDWPQEKHPRSFTLRWPDGMRDWALAHYGGHQIAENT